MIVTISLDGTARIWDTDPHPSELAQLTLPGEGHRITILGPSTLAVSSSRGFLERYAKLPVLKSLTCEDACEKRGFA